MGGAGDEVLAGNVGTGQLDLLASVRGAYVAGECRRGDVVTVGETLQRVRTRSIRRRRPYAGAIGERDCDARADLAADGSRNHVARLAGIRRGFRRG